MMTFSSVMGLLGAAIGMIAGLGMLFAPERFRWDHVRNKDREIADRLARGTDAWFEELRTLEAYREPSSATTVRFFGGLLVVLCGTIIALRLSGAGQ